MIRSVRDGGFEEAKNTRFPSSSSSSTLSTFGYGRSSSSMTLRSFQNETKEVTNASFTRIGPTNMSSMAWCDGPETMYTTPLTRSGTGDNLDEFFSASEAEASPHYKGWDIKNLRQTDRPKIHDHHTSGKIRQVVPRLVKKEMKLLPTSTDRSEVSVRTSRRSAKPLQVGHGDKSSRLENPCRRAVTATERQLHPENICIRVHSSAYFVDV